MGRRLTGYIHTSANEVLRKVIFPVLRDDAVTRCIKYDELLILFGNKLCDRYTNVYQHDIIRAHLRLLGRYKLAIQNIKKEIVPNATKVKKKYLRACPLMRKFSHECGATIPSSLRGTTFRKQIATYTAMLNIEDIQVDNLANFMRHAKEIHKSIYRMPIPIKEMTDVSRLLEAAMGNDDNDNEACNNNISDTDSASQLSITSEEIAQKNNYIPDSDNDNFDDETIEHSSNHTARTSHSEHCNNSQFEKAECKEKKNKQVLIFNVAAWFNPEIDIFYSDMEKELDQIAQDVMEYLKIENFRHPIFKISQEQFSVWKRNDLDQDQWDNCDAIQILDILVKIFFHKLKIILNENDWSRMCEVIGCQINTDIYRKLNVSELTLELGDYFISRRSRFNTNIIYGYIIPYLDKATRWFRKLEDLVKQEEEYLPTLIREEEDVVAFRNRLHEVPE
ncbi:hypothetical protein DMN91_011803 [Ooceraea biroi]|uniref:Uncharacterized protein n=1 Tax=Ooceraea biroi TaxID=2015173 RepID=A0A3L8D6F8_OOCBI|nr:hypothetical protein DMN91_011803 [Ooceraea biroi]